MFWKVKSIPFLILFYKSKNVREEKFFVSFRNIK